MLTARFSKDREHSLIFAGSAGRNELRVWDNDTEEQGRFRELANLGDNTGVIMCMDTAKNGRSVAWANHYGQVYISFYDLQGEEKENEPDLRTIKGRLEHKRNQEAR